MKKEVIVKSIFVNGRFLTQKITGVQAFAHGICGELSEAGIPFTLLVPKKVKRISTGFNASILETGIFKGHLWEQFDLPRFMKTYPEAILLNLCNTAPVTITKQISTIHDLAFQDHPEWFHPLFSAWYRFVVPRVCNISEKIVTVSETIRNEIVSVYNVPMEKIVVTGNKVSNELLAAISIKPGDDRIQSGRYFLMVGTADPRKNFTVAENWISKQTGEFNLVIAGGQNRNFATSANIESEKIIRTGYTSFSQLKWLYQNAVALINPSLYEGFGIPNLEAMAMGCPVICSDMPVFREICGGTAIYFKPTDTASLQEAVNILLNNKVLTETKITEGKVIFTRFQNQDRTQIFINPLAG